MACFWPSKLTFWPPRRTTTHSLCFQTILQCCQTSLPCIYAVNKYFKNTEARGKTIQYPWSATSQPIQADGSAQCDTFRCSKSYETWQSCRLIWRQDSCKTSRWQSEMLLRYCWSGGGSGSAEDVQSVSSVPSTSHHIPEHLLSWVLEH